MIVKEERNIQKDICEIKKIVCQGEFDKNSNEIGIYTKNTQKRRKNHTKNLYTIHCRKK